MPTDKRKISVSTVVEVLFLLIDSTKKSLVWEVYNSWVVYWILRSIALLKEHTTISCLGPVESSRHRHTLFLEDHFECNPPNTPSYSKWYLLLSFSEKNLCRFRILLMRALFYKNLTKTLNALWTKYSFWVLKLWRHTEFGQNNGNATDTVRISLLIWCWTTFCL
jgi:hypothetical protein